MTACWSMYGRLRQSGRVRARTHRSRKGVRASTHLHLLIGEPLPEQLWKKSGIDGVMDEIKSGAPERTLSGTNAKSPKSPLFLVVFEVFGYLAKD